MWKVCIIWFLLIPHPTLTASSSRAGLEQAVLKQDETYGPIRFDKARLSDYRKDPDFDYSQTVQESWWTRLKNYLRLQWSRFIIWLFGEVPTNNVLLFIVKVLPYLILLGVLFFFIWLFHRLNPGGAFSGHAPTNTVFTTEEEAIIASQDIDQMIENALGEEDYRMAIRLQYLQVLQFLKNEGLIHYRADKTNADYARELDQDFQKNTFLILSRIYDYTWYGHFRAHRKKFEQMQNGYLELIDKTGKADNEKR